MISLQGMADESFLLNNQLSCFLFFGSFMIIPYYQCFHCNIQLESLVVNEGPYLKVIKGMTISVEKLNSPPLL